MLKPIIIAALALPLATTSIASPADAQTVSTRVSYADLDLTTEAGRNELNRRVNRAARKVCGGGTPGQEIGMQEAIRRCQVAAIRGSRTQVAFAIDRAQNRASGQQLAAR